MSDTIITLFLGVLAGIFIVLMYIYIKLKIMMSTLDKYIDEAIDEVKDSFVPLVVEKENNTYFCYREADRQFMCQGNTLEEIRKAFGEKFPTKTAYIADSTEADIKEELKEAITANPES